MKTILICMTLLVLGCGDVSPSLNTLSCMQTVVNTYPEANIIVVPGEKYKYLVAINCEVRQVEVMG